jgi:glutamyl-tRNA reductase
MKYEKGESFEEWLDRVQKFEYGLALQRIANKEPIEKVLEDMSRRMVEKGLHPIFKAIREPSTNYNVEESRKSYEEYMKKFGPKPDHVQNDE